MISRRLVTRSPLCTLLGQSHMIRGSICNRNINLSDQPFSQISTRELFSGASNNFKRLIDNMLPKLSGKFTQVNSLPSTMKFASFIHSTGPKKFERGNDYKPFETTTNPTRGPIDMNRNQPPIEPTKITRHFEGLNNRPPIDMYRNLPPIDRGSSVLSESERNNRSMNFVRGMINENLNDINVGNSRFPRGGIEQNADIVHIKIMRNNTFITVTDSKGNKITGASAGALAEMKGGPKVSRYSAEATAEHVGRVAKNMGLKSVVMKVNGFTHFKRKKQAILSFRDGYTNSRTDQNPVVYIEDTTRKPHNGCRLKKKRRV